MKRLLLSTTLVATLWCGAAHAQIIGCPNPSPAVPCTAIQGFVPQAGASLSPGTTSSNVAIPASGSNLNVLLWNTGTVDLYYLLGTTSGVVATTSNAILKAGYFVWVPKGSFTYLAAITASGASSGATSLTILSGTGTPTIVYGNTTVTLAAGSAISITGTVTTIPAATTPVTASSALESNHVLKGAAGSFFGVQVNTTSSAEWVMLFNLTSLPSNGAVTPVAWWQVPANWTLSISENPGLVMGTGIVVGCSTTGPFTLTASALCTFGAGVVQ